MSHSCYFVTVLLSNITLWHCAEFFFIRLLRYQIGNSGWACFWQKPPWHFNPHNWQGMKAAEYTVTSCTALKELKKSLEPGWVLHLLREGEDAQNGFTVLWDCPMLWVWEITACCPLSSSVLWLAPQKILVLGTAREGNYILFNESFLYCVSSP